MATVAREHDDRGHSAKYLILIFLVCVATCGVFFSLGFLVGFNEHGSHAAPVTEVVTPPPAIPPAINPPADGGQVAAPDSSSVHTPASTLPETEVIPPGGPGSAPPAPVTKPAEAAPAKDQPTAKPAPAPAPAAPPALAPGEVGEGITLQVAALRTKQDAEALVDILKTRGYPVFMVTPEYAHAEDNLYRVQVGPFRTREDADKVRAKLTQEGFKPFVKH